MSYFKKSITLMGLTAYACLSSGSLHAAAQTGGSHSDLLRQALTPQNTKSVYSYDLHVKTPDMTAHARINPAMPIGQRVHVISPPKNDWTADFEREVINVDKTANEDLWCDTMSDEVPQNAQIWEETDTTLTFMFTPLADPNDPDDANIVKHLSGYVTISKQNPVILSVKLIAKKSFKPVAFVRINKMELDITCQRAPNGRSYMAQSISNISGRMMMKKFSEREVLTISELRYVNN